MPNHDFCRLMLKQIRPWFNKAVKDSAVRKRCWNYLYDNGNGEWHGPNNFYWYGSACCAYMARYNGIIAYLQIHHPDIYKEAEDHETEVEKNASGQ